MGIAISLGPLLQLQACDGRRQQTEKELGSIPREREAAHAAIAAEKAKAESARQELRTQELKAKEVEGRLKACEDRIFKLRNQQPLIKKNDEYRALLKEISDAEAEKGVIEEEEIGALYHIDEARQSATRVDAALRDTLRELDARLAQVAAREGVLQTRLIQDQADVAAARALVPEASLREYDRRAKAGKFPVVVRLEGHSCGGCHMKVSAEAELEALKARELAQCDYCGRILHTGAA